MDTPDVAGGGGVDTDYLIKGERLPQPGETLQGDVFQEAWAGRVPIRPSRQYGWGAEAG